MIYQKDNIFLVKKKKKRKVNKKGQVFVWKFMIVFLALVAAVVLLDDFIDLASTTRTNMSCGTAGLSSGTQMACLLVDIIPFVYIGGVVGGAIALLFSRKGGA